MKRKLDGTDPLGKKYVMRKVVGFVIRNSWCYFSLECGHMEFMYKYDIKTKRIVTTLSNPLNEDIIEIGCHKCGNELEGKRK
jgi:hypothetical protein